MKKTLFFFLILIPGLLAAQTGDHCAKMLQKAKAALKIKEYALARDYCEAALPLCPDMAAQFEQVQSDVNKGIENEKITAKREAEKARRALEQVKTVNNDVAELLLRNTEEHILKLEYDAAFEKMKKAAILEGLNDGNKTEVAYFLMEIAFFHHYTHQTDRDRAPYDLAAGLLGKNALKGKMDFESLNPDRARFLEKRYFGEMVDLKGGTFQMQGEKYGGDIAEYEATVSDFEMSKYETTVWQYNLFCVANGRSISQRINKDSTGLETDKYQPPWGWIGNNPVVHVSWYDACEYANWLSLKRGKKPAYSISTQQDTDNTNNRDDFKWTITIIPKANGFRLPTELEWEFAAKGGIRRDTFMYSGSHSLDTVGWFGDNSESRTRAVGGKKANGAGLFDLSGNVWEWCFDWYGYLPAKTAGNYRVIRGGSWSYDAGSCRAAYRSRNWPYRRDYLYGFRLALSPQ